MSKKVDTWRVVKNKRVDYAKQPINEVPTRECGEDIRQPPKKKEDATWTKRRER